MVLVAVADIVLGPLLRRGAAPARGPGDAVPALLRDPGEGLTALLGRARRRLLFVEVAVVGHDAARDGEVQLPGGHRPGAVDALQVQRHHGVRVVTGVEGHYSFFLAWLDLDLVLVAVAADVPMRGQVLGAETGCADGTGVFVCVYGSQFAVQVGIGRGRVHAVADASELLGAVGVDEDGVDAIGGAVGDLKAVVAGVDAVEAGIGTFVGRVGRESVDGANGGEEESGGSGEVHLGKVGGMLGTNRNYEEVSWAMVGSDESGPSQEVYASRQMTVCFPPFSAPGETFAESVPSLEQRAYDCAAQRDNRFAVASK
ncbi:uncharacterized protein PG986_011465 [Apiospora aurea]|uniref:Uncharacterized protein n=1 Tax=Apiospora aurea TaxID=335848 RepID=A0ABR1Q536_9PEZI